MLLYIYICIVFFKLKCIKKLYFDLKVYDPDVAPLEINVGEIVHLLAKEEELVAARTKADNLERENVDLATELAKKVTYFKFMNNRIYI